MVPAQNSVRGNDRGDASEDPSAEDLALGSEATTLGVGQSKAFSAELLLQDSVLFDEELDDVDLVPVHPACERGQEQLKWEENGHVAWIIDSTDPLRKARVCSAIRVRLSFRIARV